MAVPVSVLLAGGNALDEIQAEAESALEFVTKSKFGPAINLITVALVLTRALRGLTPRFGSFDSSDFDEARFAQQLEVNPLAASWFWIRKVQSRYLAGEYAAALAAVVADWGRLFARDRPPCSRAKETPAPVAPSMPSVAASM